MPKVYYNNIFHYQSFCILKYQVLIYFYLKIFWKHYKNLNKFIFNSETSSNLFKNYKSIRIKTLTNHNYLQDKTTIELHFLQVGKQRKFSCGNWTKRVSYKEKEKKSRDLRGFICDRNSLGDNNSTSKNLVSHLRSSEF